MRFEHLFALTMTLLISPPGKAQLSDPLKPIYEKNQVFRLRDAVLDSNASAFYKGAVNASFNRVRAAETELRSVIRHSPNSDEAYEAHDLLGNMYFRNGMYREGHAEIVAALQARPNAADPRSMLSIFTALNALPRMMTVKVEPSVIPIERGTISLPLKANGHDLKFFFDTGAGISVIGESEAKELGIITKPVEGTMGDASGQGVSGLQLAMVEDLRIGGLHLRNVPFLVIADSGEPWIHAPKTEHGIIGLPVLLAMHTLRWRPTGSFEFDFTPQPFKANECNMLFHNSNPVIDVSVADKHLDFTLDTGAVDTDLNPQFAKSLPDIMKNGVPEKRSLEGLGGKVENASISLPSVTFKLGGKDVVLKPAHVFTEQGNGTWASGNLGMDLLKQAQSFTLDFSAMELRLQ
ncbi:putative aspartyl protease [Granulicella aggregans]|uniref:Putative aspartyl protease n=1 Tax=Granulicella aggregans TaxID=474949 RepID=A0A7W8E6F5_9BACT|nr:aspartyl protease family protein [Granulicella aggregans]MBB5060259.1 putative aspartyl protease [Granulicella aggregans]